MAACYTTAQGCRGTFGKTLGARRLFKISIETSKSANFVTVAADDVFGRGGILNILKTTNPSGLIQGTKMAAISLGQGSHPTITSNTEAGQFSNSDSRFGVDQLRDNVDRVSLGKVTSRPQESSGRFVNFLLGRGGHYPR